MKVGSYKLMITRPDQCTSQLWDEEGLIHTMYGGVGERAKLNMQTIYNLFWKSWTSKISHVFRGIDDEASVKI